MHTVVHNDEGTPITFPEALTVQCQSCGHEWIAILTHPLPELVCPVCRAVTQIEPGMHVKVLKQATPEDVAAILHNIGTPPDGFTLQLLDTLSRQLTVTATATAPLTWWMQLSSHGIPWYVEPKHAPLRQEDMAVPMAPDHLDEVNEQALDPVSLQGHIPSGTYFTGVTTMTYRQLEMLIDTYRHCPVYEWQVFLQEVRKQVEAVTVANLVQEVAL